jgi:hypothetical protein
MSRKTDLTMIDQDDGTTTVSVATEASTKFTMHLDAQVKAPEPPPAPAWPDLRTTVEQLQNELGEANAIVENQRNEILGMRAELDHERAKAQRRKKAAARRR